MADFNTMEKTNNPDLSSGIIRIIDANLNRAAEGLRVLEDVARMLLSNVSLTSELKSLRHFLEHSSTYSRQALLSARDSQGDIGQEMSVELSRAHKDTFDIVTANARRVEQALRTLEEIARLPDSNMESDTFQKMRFNLYDIEKRLFSLLARKQKQSQIKGLYVVLDSNVSEKHDHIIMTKTLLDAGVKIIQLNEKNVAAGRMLELASSLQQVCNSYDALLVINSRLDIVLTSGAGGLHLDMEDTPLPKARQYLPAETIIGISVYSTEEAVKAAQAGADYLYLEMGVNTYCEGSLSTSYEALSTIRKAISIPLVANCNTNIDNITRTIEAGADAVAVKSTFFKPEEPGEDARTLIDKLDQANYC
jgi:thiamine-phosphate pyrophosphorylase